LRDWVDENNPVRAVDVFVQAQFVELCRKMGLLAKASVAIDGSKFKAVNNRDNNFTKGNGAARRGRHSRRAPGFAAGTANATAKGLKDRIFSPGQGRRGHGSLE
jgi:hypothetical protein